MSERFEVKHPIHPLIGLCVSVMLVVTGLLTAKSVTSLYYLGAVWVLFLCFGYYRACFAVVPVAMVMSLILAGITYAVSKDAAAAQAAVSRILAVCVAVIPGMALPPILIVRSFSALHIPRGCTLGMMITLSFFPLLRGEVRQVREAMKTRGAGSILSPKIFYRAFLIPLVTRLVNISDTLALSVETRGFTTGSAATYTVYRTVSVGARDIGFAVIFVLCTGMAVVL